MGLSACCGCLFGTMGVFKIFGSISDGANALRREEAAIDGRDSQTKRIARIVANALVFVGAVALGLAALSISSTLFTVGATAGLVVALQQGFMLALPKVIIGLSTIVGGAILNRLGGGPIFRQNENFGANLRQQIEGIAGRRGVQLP